MANLTFLYALVTFLGQQPRRMTTSHIFWMEDFKVCLCLVQHIAYLLGVKAPIECYVMQGECPLPTVVVEQFAKTGGELCKNVFLMSTFMKYCISSSRSDIFVHLGKSGIITTANGLRIACLGGTFEPSIYGSAEAAPVRVFSCFVPSLMFTTT
jgi:hypothetical protein